jgi:hypothetical protein
MKRPHFIRSRDVRAIGGRVEKSGWGQKKRNICNSLMNFSL